MNAPLPRSIIDRNRPVLAIVFGVLFVAYSALSTILGVWRDTTPRLGPIVLYGYLPAGLLLGMVVALLIFVGEIVFSEGPRFWYLVCLVPDVVYSAQPLHWFFQPIVQASGMDLILSDALTIALSFGLGALVAYGGEILLFGKRRKRGAHDTTEHNRVRDAVAGDGRAVR